VFSVSTSRTYRSELREQQAERTRQLIATAARARFLEGGWSGTSVRSVAQDAGVSEATVYSVYGSKAGLASSLLDAAEQSADVRRTVAELQEHAGNPVEQLRAFVAFDRRLFELGGDVIRVLAEARRQHPELGAAYVEGRARGESERAKVFGSWPADAWRAGMDLATASRWRTTRSRSTSGDGSPSASRPGGTPRSSSCCWRRDGAAVRRR
jgi:AcrR family transcriptional regulator